MQRLLSAIKGNLSSHNLYGALFMTLTLPDICGKVEFPDKTPGNRYKEFCKKYLVPFYTQVIIPEKEPEELIHPEDFWAFRCAMLHAGSRTTANAHFIFLNRHYIQSDTGPIPIELHRMKDGEKIFISVFRFCEEIVEILEDWNNRNKLILDIDIQNSFHWNGITLAFK
jgi:hypothetical protein